jgi:hypothetical protein
VRPGLCLLSILSSDTHPLLLQTRHSQSTIPAPILESEPCLTLVDASLRGLHWSWLRAWNPEASMVVIAGVIDCQEGCKFVPGDPQ